MLAFAQRHEAHPIELFFDLFFVANLATFTAYHSIVDRASFLAYIGKFLSSPLPPVVSSV